MQDIEYQMLKVEIYDFENPDQWVKIGPEKSTLCDFCFENQAEFRVFCCACWEGGRVGCAGGGDIDVYYCSNCRSQKRRKRLTQRYLDELNDWS